MRDFILAGKQGLAILVVLAVIVVVIFGSISLRDSERVAMTQWVEQQNCDLVSIEETWLDNGPFWVRDDHHRIYRVTVRDGNGRVRHAYFRFGGFVGHDVEWHR